MVVDDSRRPACIRCIISLPRFEGKKKEKKVASLRKYKVFHLLILFITELFKINKEESFDASGIYGWVCCFAVIGQYIAKTVSQPHLPSHCTVSVLVNDFRIHGFNFSATLEWHKFRITYIMSHCQ